MRKQGPPRSGALMPCDEYRGLTHPYKTGLYGEECLLFINSSQDSYLSDVGLNPTECWPLTQLHDKHQRRGSVVVTTSSRISESQKKQTWTRGEAMSPKL